ncbi:MAG: hypothetical protein L0J32_10180 [Brevibacterium sp.]|nr:hypothetical protein [Brevibacterium sp.]MDN6192256.1 hypothetical protein [Brevibacterium sp.]MDN6528681.1 hypothetical protein [Brevibacterium sp.]
MSQQASAGGDPYSPNWYGGPTAWAPAVSVAAAVGPERTVGPGWTARILFWAALAIGSLPEIVMTPMLIGGGRPEFFTLYSAMIVVVAILELVLGIVALLIVRASPMTMRLFGTGLLLGTTIYAFVLPHLMAIIVNRVVGNFGIVGGSDLAVRSQSIIWTFRTGVVLAGSLIAWNLARNRAWWTNLVAAGYALLMGLVVSFVEWALNWFGYSFASSTVLTQFVVLAAVVGGLGLLHLVGRVSNLDRDLPLRPRFRSSRQRVHRSAAAASPRGFRAARPDRSRND